MCELAARAPAPLVPLRIARIGLLPGEPARDSRELARVPERLEVQEDDIGGLVVLPVLEQVVRRDVGLVADRDEAREPEPAPVRLLEQREAERAALGREADAAGGQRAPRERRVQTRAGRGDAEAVRPDQARTVRAHEREQLVLARRSLGAGLGEPGRDDAERLHAGASAARAASSTRSPGTQMIARSTVSGTSPTRVAGDAADRLARAVDGIGGAGEVGLKDVAEELAADRAASRGKRR